MGKGTTNQQIYMTAVEFLAADALVKLLLEVVELTSFLKYSMKIGNRRKKLMKTIGIKDDYKEILVWRERLHDFWRYFNFASCSNILELTDIVLSLLLAYFDVLSPW